MKKITFASIILILLFSESCIDDVSVDNSPKKYTGKLILKSEPDSAKIFLLGTDMHKTTPDSIVNLQSGDYDVTLKLKNYRDTSFIANVYDKFRTEKFIELTVLPEAFSIFIDSDPQGAEIFLSGISTKKFTPDSITNLNKSTYTISLKKENYIDTTFTVTLDHDLKIDQNIVLRKEEFGSIFVQSEPENAQIFLFNDSTGKTTPDSILNLTEGKYDLTLKLQDYYDTTFTTDVEKNKVTDVYINLAPKLSEVNVDLTYLHIPFNQILFNFSFDKDVNLDKVEVLKPDSTVKSIFNFGRGYVYAGEKRIMIFTGDLKGKWVFTFYGVQTDPKKSEFVVIKEINVE